MVRPHRDCFNASVAEKVRWFKEATWDGELGFQTRMTLKDLLEGALREEALFQLCSERYKHDPRRRDQLNGYYVRSLQMAGGTIPDLVVPRSRKGLFDPHVFDRYARRTVQVDEAICQMFLRGVSTREVGEVLEVLTGSAVSATTVSEVCKALDGHVRAYHTRPLQDQYQYLLLDGITLKCKAATGLKKVVVLTAYGVTLDGRRELIDFCPAQGESEADWTRLLESLHKRGLRGAHLRMITTDGARGLIAALDMVYAHVPRQRCWVHKLRNVANRLRARNRPACLGQASMIYKAKCRAEAIQRFKQWKADWQEREPKAVACLEADLDDLLTCFDLPEAHRPTVRTTNPIERAFREVRRRTRPMSCFQNPASLQRIIFAVLSHLNAKWSKHPIQHFTQDS
jgi:putative transposase